MKLTDLTKEQLIEEVKKLKSRKKYGLVWEDKPEDVVEQCKTKLPVLEEVANKAIVSNENLPTNLIIEGDNYHALSVLNYTHQGKIDVIYIDPPYNTGASDWKYNNDYVDINDTYRHSKWCAFMYHRIALARNLLTSNGVLCVTIDNYEIHNLRHILEIVFPEKEIVITVIEHNHRGRAKNNFALTHEYALWVLPKGVETITRREDISDEIKRNLRRTGQGSRRRQSPSMFYGIEVHKKTLEIISVTKAIPDGEKLPITNNPDTIFVFPIDSSGIERRWYYGRDTVLKEAQDGRVWAKIIKGRHEVHYRKPGKPMRRKSVWIGAKYDGSTYGTEELTKMLGEQDFPFPKSLYAVIECIEASSSKKDAIILDFFAGSGTTGHASLYLNQKDGKDGKRTFILCTNNENGIAEQITYPRIKKVIEGYSKSEGIPANIKYFKTSFVSKSKVSDDTRSSLVRKSVEMICVRENTFTKLLDKKGYKLYRNHNLITGILFDLDEIDIFKEKIAELGLPTQIYVFSLTNDTYSSDFRDLEVKHELCPIPESILEVYRKLFKA